MNRHVGMILVFLLLVSSFLTGCYGSGTSNTQSKPNTETATPAQPATTTPAATESSAGDPQMLNLIASGEIPTLKTNGIMDGLSATIIMNIYEGLYRLAPDNKPTPGVAERYDVSEDRKTYTFHLRQDAKWSNGQPVTAQDFVYAWGRALHPDTLSPHAYLMDDIQNAKAIQEKGNPLYGKVEELGAKAVDASTLVVTLEHAVPYFLDLVTGSVYFPQNKEFIDAQKDQYALEAQNLLFNGPFILDSWQHEKGWVLKKNPGYWDAESVKMEAINFNVVKDVTTGINLYETGALDVADLSSEVVDLYNTNPDFTTALKTEMYFIRLNQKNPYLKNVNIRRAIDMAWNKKQAAELVLKNGSIPAYFLVPKQFVFSPDGGQDFRDKYGDFNADGKEKALEYWNKGLSELGVKQIELEFLSYDDESRKKVAEFIQNELEKSLPGLTVKINQQPNKQKLALESKLNYAMSFSGWRSSLQDPVDFLGVFLSDGAYNWQGFANAKYDQLIRLAMTDFSDINARFHNLQEAEKILVGEEVVISPLYQAASARLIKPYVKGFVAHPNSTFSYKWAYIEGKK
ncbi:peptide ABC transporter substrate-binding protein [Brevibacillus reuszeri]|uniref:Solute-binding protein family 5 domain-containing protein n=2 Tax=Brevibacillus reuszeri TaxID=54915 RepID=A0A0K9YLC2_9BACL|nr:peptide ABC transporter substrate-binding protein [Brevibacillus reuszeri]KNB69543.1 hypothetical protein ADS79_27145 [Brevibacillus reuszeri]MED1856091.1 ABC transporter substrate-binding protein [Brevibacillus reuszeri]